MLCNDKYKIMLFTGQDVRIEKNCTQDWGHSFYQYEPTKVDK